MRATTIIALISLSASAVLAAGAGKDATKADLDKMKNACKSADVKSHQVCTFHCLGCEGGEAYSSEFYECVSRCCSKGGNWDKDFMCGAFKE